jgi:GNAT superfamily N-acetyltransferase
VIVPRDDENPKQAPGLIQRRIPVDPRKPAGWLPLRRQLDGLSKPAFIALVKDLYDLSPGNRDFLQARLESLEDSGATLEKYRRRVVEPFYPKRGFGKLKLAEARRAIRDYAKATGDLVGTMDLMLTFVEEGTEFTVEFGDINEAFYRSLESVLGEVVERLRTEHADLYPQFRDRICHLRDDGRGIGWGYGDYVQEQVDLLESELAGE